MRNVCGYPEIADGLLYATVDELKRLKELGSGSKSVWIASRRRFSSPAIDRERHPAIMLSRSPERDRDIESLQTLIRNRASVGIPCINYNMSILGVLRTSRTWRLKLQHLAS